MLTAELALQGFEIKLATMTASAVVAPDRCCLAALKPIVNRIGVSVCHRLALTRAAPALVGKFQTTRTCLDPQR